MNLMKDNHVHFENRRISRRFFAFIWLMYALLYMTRSCFSSAMAAIVKEGVLTLTETSWISAAFYIAYTPMQIVGGLFADKYSPEKLITIGLLGSAASNIVIFFCQNYAVMLIAWVFSAMIQFALWPAVFKIVSSQLVRSDRSSMVFYLSFATSGGLMISYVAAAFIPRWQDNFALSAVVLLLLAAAMPLACRCANRYLIPDREKVQPVMVEEKAERENHTSTVKLFLTGGLVAVLPAVLIRTMVENATKTLSPTMLMQSYEGVSPMLGNLLNILIIASGILGMLLIKTVVYPRLIKNEIACYLLMLLCAFPFVVLLHGVGEAPIALMILALCVTALTLTSTHMLTQYYTTRYEKHGKDGTAAGLINAASSLGLVLQYCLFGPLADSFGWQQTIWIWIGMVAVAILTIAFAVRPTKRI